MSKQFACHRKISIHNQDEFDKVVKSLEIWGRQRKNGGDLPCVQAYPGHTATVQEYSFLTNVIPKPSFGFVGKVPHVREYRWELGMTDVDSRDKGEFAAIKICDPKM
jgi:hypothetical protein